MTMITLKTKVGITSILSKVTSEFVSQILNFDFFFFKNPIKEFDNSNQGSFALSLVYSFFTIIFGIFW